MSKEAEMSPDASPGQVSKKTGVRRVNNMPMYLLGGVLGLFLLMMMLVAADRSAQQNAPAEAAAERAGNTSMFANEIAGEYTDGMIEPAAPLVPPDMPTMPAEDEVAPVDPILVAVPDDLNAPPLPPRNGNHSISDDEAQRIRMAKMQMLEEAVKARTGVQASAPRSAGSSQAGASQNPDDIRAQIAAVQERINAVRRDDPTAAYQARLAQIRGETGAQVGGSGGGMGGAPQLLQTSAGTADSFAQFGGGEGDRWRLESQLEAPRSPYELRAGFVVPATLISGINSDLPGQITAQVSQDVSDTATGRHLLIPQGSRLVGSYSSDVAFGQKRVLVAWQRIVFPDGKAMDIGSMPGADGAGYSGFNDKVNNHFIRLFGSAFLMSGVTAGITLSQGNGNDDSGNNQRASDALSEALGQQLGQATAQLIAKNMNIAPTLEIRPGYRFNVIVTKDMTFSKPYQSFDY